MIFSQNNKYLYKMFIIILYGKYGKNNFKGTGKLE